MDRAVETINVLATQNARTPHMKPTGPQQQMTKHDSRMCVPYVEYL